MCSLIGNAVARLILETWDSFLIYLRFTNSTGSRLGLQLTLVTTTAFVPKDGAIEMNLLLYRILNEKIDM